jgi:hypothetical protein
MQPLEGLSSKPKFVIVKATYAGIDADGMPQIGVMVRQLAPGQPLPSGVLIVHMDVPDEIILELGADQGETRPLHT